MKVKALKILIVFCPFRQAQADIYVIDKSMGMRRRLILYYLWLNDGSDLNSD